MADIELVIKIPEEIRQAIIYNIPLSFEQKSTLDRYVNHAIINGTPLNEVLDKIRAEIKAEKIKEKRYDNDNHIFIHKDICIGLQEAHDIIDKYTKGENE